MKNSIPYQKTSYTLGSVYNSYCVSKDQFTPQYRAPGGTCTELVKAGNMCISVVLGKSYAVVLKTCHIPSDYTKCTQIFSGGHIGFAPEGQIGHGDDCKVLKIQFRGITESLRSKL